MVSAAFSGITLNLYVKFQMNWILNANDFSSKHKHNFSHTNTQTVSTWEKRAHTHARARTRSHSHWRTLKGLYDAIVYLSDARAAYVFDGPTQDRHPVVVFSPPRRQSICLAMPKSLRLPSIFKQSPDFRRLPLKTQHHYNHNNVNSNKRKCVWKLLKYTKLKIDRNFRQLLSSSSSMNANICHRIEFACLYNIMYRRKKND